MEPNTGRALTGVVRELVSSDAALPEFSLDERKQLIAAISRVKILDPACGSGAFPMGMLQRLVEVLNRLDAGNELWKAEQQKQINALDVEEIRQSAQKRLDEVWARDAGDYARKLYLIENCLFGVDIQPIATQITKLRFFISLVIEQHTNHASHGVESGSAAKGRVITDAVRDVQPLPNLETKIVAANTLLRPNGAQGVLVSPDAKALEDELFETRRNHFSAQSYKRKKQLRDQDKRLREALAAELESVGMPHESATQMAAWNPYDQNAFAPFFDPEWMFGPNLKDGFDIVIGNPPYNAALTLQERKYFKESYDSVSSGRQDTAAIFVEFAQRVGRKNSSLVYILPYRLFSRKRNHGQFQTWLLQNLSVKEIMYLGIGIYCVVEVSFSNCLRQKRL